MRPKKKYQIQIADYSALSDEELLDLTQYFLKKFKTDALVMNPKSTKKVAIYFVELHFWTRELQARFPEYLEGVSQEIELKNILNKLEIKN